MNVNKNHEKNVNKQNRNLRHDTINNRINNIWKNIYNFKTYLENYNKWQYPHYCSETETCSKILLKGI